MQGLSWSHAEYWPYLLLLPVFGLLLFFMLRGARRGVEVYAARLSEPAPSSLARSIVLSLAAAAFLLTWMDPLLGEEKVAVERRGLDVIFCLDSSRSMLARDIEPNRLERAKRDIRSMLPELIGGDRVALVVFAGRAKLIVPLTHDLDSFRHLLADVDTDSVRLGGSDLAAALRKGVELTEEGFQNTTVMVMLTDGEDLSGAARQAAREVRDADIVLHTLGYGSTRGSKITLEGEQGEEFLTSEEGEEVVSVLDVDGLRRMSAVTGGEFIRADQMALPLVELKQKRMDPMLKRAYDAGEEVVRKTRFQWVLFPGLLLILLEMWICGGRRK
ncbi:MAG: vWA domain-containing protein [Planctomycetota bacterium]|jgi:Ca-activated chloride channel family protein